MTHVYFRDLVPSSASRSHAHYVLDTLSAR